MDTNKMATIRSGQSRSAGARHSRPIKYPTEPPWALKAHDDPEYQEAAEIRRRNADSIIVVVAGVRRDRNIPNVADLP